MYWYTAELDYGSSSNEKALVMIFNDILESDRRFEGEFLQVVVTEIIK